MNQPASEKVKVRRLPANAVYDRKAIESILDEGYVCHVGVIENDSPVVIPMAYVRVGESLFLHGSKGSRLLRRLAEGSAACVTVTHFDGLVLARSAFNHSMNYRSVVIHGTASAVADGRKVEILDALMDKIAPGRKSQVRPGSREELLQTLVVEIPLKESSAKVRTGPPSDDEEDKNLPVWAGVIPFTVQKGEPIPA